MRDALVGERVSQGEHGANRPGLNRGTGAHGVANRHSCNPDSSEPGWAGRAACSGDHQ